MADTTWLTSVAVPIIEGVTVEDQPDVELSLQNLEIRLEAADDATGDQLRNSFIGSLLGRNGDAAAAADAISDELITILSSISAVRTILNAPGVVTDALEDAAAPLRTASQVAWGVVKAAGTTVRTVERLEKIAAKAAAVTGLPPVVIAWGLAADVKFVALEVAEISARAGRAADTAWGEVQKVIDRIIDAQDALLGSLKDLLENTVLNVLTVPGASRDVVYVEVRDDLVTVFDTIAPIP